jgi:branched-chain amino acid transport system ATP-binding protein
MAALLQARDLVVGYSEVPILRGVSFELGENEIVAIIGPNGAGKSTLIKAVFGVLKPIEGAVTLEGRDITGWSPEHIVPLGMSYVPQVNNVFRTLTVRENLEMGAYILNFGPSGRLGSGAQRVGAFVRPRLRRARRRLVELIRHRRWGAADLAVGTTGRPRFYPSDWVAGSEIDRRIDEVIQLFPDLRKRLRERTGNLSGGQQQMVAIARAFMLKPKILLIDEPSAGLAPKLVDSVFAQIQTVHEAGTSIALVEQNARKALHLADRGYILEAGRNRFDDRADRLLANPDIGQMFLGGGSASPRP